VFVEMKIYAAV